MKIEFTLIRESISEKGKATMGRLLDENNNFICYTLEDLPQQYKIAGETRIDNGVYQIVITHSPRFNKPMPLLLNVKNFTGIRIHSGNNASHTDGCILVGMTLNIDNGTIGYSRKAYNKLFAIIEEILKNDNDLFLNIIEKVIESKPEKKETVLEKIINFTKNIKFITPA